MRVNFVLPGLSLAGGIRVVADYAKRLGVWGHDVTVAWPRHTGPSMVDTVRDLIRGRVPVSELWPKKRGPKRTYFDEGADRIRLVECARRQVSSDDLPDADVTVGTWWFTLEWMAGFPARLGEQVHFVQGDDSQTPGQPMERLVAAWSRPMHRIAVAAWLREPIYRFVGEVPVSIVLNGVDARQFFASPRGKSPHPTVGYTYSPLAIKGCDLIADAIRRARRERPGLRVVAFGERLPGPGDCPLPELVEIAVSPPQDTIRDIYAACDWWVWASRVEGFGLPMLEAMACRTPVIATPAGAARELVATGGGRLVERCDASLIGDAIVELCGLSAGEWEKYSRAAFEFASSRSCDVAAREFEAALLTICGRAS
jgi:glycosyltransferase involved in cell wall biosynthesis